MSVELSCSAVAVGVEKEDTQRHRYFSSARGRSAEKYLPSTFNSSTIIVYIHPCEKLLCNYQVGIMLHTRSELVIVKRTLIGQLLTLALQSDIETVHRNTRFDASFASSRAQRPMKTNNKSALGEVRESAEPEFAINRRSQAVPNKLHRALSTLSTLLP
jgi:hypothetical protein